MRESLHYASTQEATMTFKVTSRFGDTEWFRHQAHGGIDFAMDENSPLASIGDGVITEVIKDNEIYGNAISVKLNNGDTIVYAHLNEVLVKEGQSVHTGDIIGLSGNTGFSTGAHLHVHAINENGEIIDPSKYEEAIQEMDTETFEWLWRGEPIGDAWKRFIERGKVENNLPNQSEARDFVWGKDGTVFDTFGDKLAEMVGEGVAALFFAIADSIHAVLPEIAGFASIIAGFALMMGASMPKVLARWGVVMTAIIIWIAEG